MPLTTKGEGLGVRRIAAVDQCAPGRGLYVAVAGRELAVFRLSEPDRFVVMDNACPHAGGNLSGGDLTGETVACPWHGWEFSLRSGRCTLSDRAQVRIYRSEVRDGQVFADLDGSALQ